jgi:hypothetical protein
MLPSVVLRRQQQTLKVLPFLHTHHNNMLNAAQPIHVEYLSSQTYVANQHFGGAGYTCGVAYLRSMPTQPLNNCVQRVRYLPYLLFETTSNTSQWASSITNPTKAARKEAQRQSYSYRSHNQQPHKLQSSRRPQTSRLPRPTLTKLLGKLSIAMASSSSPPHSFPPSTSMLCEPPPRA